MRAATLLAFAVSIASVWADPIHFVPPPSGFNSTPGYGNVNVRFKEVPGELCETTPGVRSFSGYADINERDHIFFWFFEAREVDSREAPLTIWLQGGPGSPSVYGLFRENGPCGVHPGNYSLYYNPYSWNNRSNVLYIDQPITTGFSYSTLINGTIDETSGLVTPLVNDSCPPGNTSYCGTFTSPDVLDIPDSTIDAAPDLWTAVQAFMGAFPQYGRSSIHLSTESYGGHFGPVFGEYFEQMNENLPDGAREIHLDSLTIGNGWFHPYLQQIAYYNFTINNTYDFAGNASAIPTLYSQLFDPGQCNDQTLQCMHTNDTNVCLAAAENCAAIGQAGTYSDRNPEDVRFLNLDPFPPYAYIYYINSVPVLQALGAYTNFTIQSGNVAQTFNFTADDSRTEGSVGDMKKLIDRGVYVYSYAGDADWECNWIGNEVVARLIDPEQSTAGFANISTLDDIVHGVVRQSGNFAFGRIYYSGHEVPFYQPLLAQTMFNRVLNRTDIETGTVPIKGRAKAYKTEGPAESLFCEGNSTVEYVVVPPDTPWNYTSGGAARLNSSA